MTETTVSGWLRKLSAQKMLQHHLIEGGVVAVGDQLLSLLLFEAARFFEQAQEGAAAVFKVGEPVFDFGGTEGMDIEANVFALLSVAVAFESAHLVEGDTEVGAAEGFVLVEF